MSSKNRLLSKLISNTGKVKEAGLSATINSDGTYAAVGAYLAHLGAVEDAGTAYIYEAG